MFLPIADSKDWCTKFGFRDRRDSNLDVFPICCRTPERRCGKTLVVATPVTQISRRVAELMSDTGTPLILALKRRVMVGMTDALSLSRTPSELLDRLITD